MSPDHLDNKAALSAYYKSHGLTNGAIAKLLRVDASSVSRYLTHAEGQTWLEHRLRLHLPRELKEAVNATVRALDLEKALAARLYPSRSEQGVAHNNIVVVKGNKRRSKKAAAPRPGAPSGDDLHLGAMGIEGARLLVDLITRRDASRATILGTTWGRSTGGVVACLAHMSLPELPKLRVVALQGGVGRAAPSDVSSQYYPNILAERLSILFRSRSQPALITLPAYIGAQTAEAVGDEGLKAIWRFIENDPSFQLAGQAHDHLDIALIGVGGLEKGAWAVSSGYLHDAALLDALKCEGARGDIVCRFFRDQPEQPIEGWVDRAADTEMIRHTNLRAIGISLSTLAARVRAGARVLAIAGGQAGAKASAVVAAILNGFVTDLVTDDRTAEEMLRTCPPPPVHDGHSKKRA